MEPSSRSSGALVEAALPLNPHYCMCNSMGTAANDITFPTFFPASHTCRVDSDNCRRFGCNISAESATYRGEVSVDPCTEVVDVNVMDSSGASIFQHSFSQSEAVPIDVGSSSPIPVHPVLYVIMQHFKFSMTVTVSFA